jgi:hypothetical protein
MAQEATLVPVNGITDSIVIIKGITTQFGLANVPYMLLYRSSDPDLEFPCAVIRNDGSFFYIADYEFNFL